MGSGRGYPREALLRARDATGRTHALIVPVTNFAALPAADGLRLDTMRVQGEETADVGPLIWAATFAWALECTPCRRASLLAIRDGERQHRRLVMNAAGDNERCTDQQSDQAALIDAGGRAGFRQCVISIR